MTPESLALLTVLGAIVGLDSVSFPQAMLSRPVVASTLAGWICGDPSAGLLTGILLECFALETMPFGASRYPEWGPASVAAGTLAAGAGAAPGATAQMLPFALLAGLIAAMLAGETLVWLRRLNLFVASRHRDALAAGDATALAAVHWTGLVLDFGRAGAVTALFVVVLLALRDAIGPALPSVSGASAALLVGVLATGVAGGAVWKVVRTTKRYGWYFVAGLAVGVVAVLMR
ncbi:MAG: PTS sugar transporter subunit IIC [Gemmatimonadetes bacterium]|nr:PTS sugar transporter subunit IIC [Gemmatimonadota bacterium]